jgi:glyoxylase-like metal-dependent hydrolase (beta-lactamase superfamily II)
MALRVLHNTGGIAATNAFLIADDETKRAVLIDAPDHTVAPLLKEAGRLGWQVEALWLTHGHFDHIADHPLAGDVPALIHRGDLEKLQNPQAMLDAFSRRSGFAVPLDIPPREPGQLIEEGNELHVGSHAATVLHTPGHSPGHVCFHFEADRLLVGGDLVIGGSIGRTDLPDSDEADMIASLRRIIALPPDTRLLPGHGSPSTIGQELESNSILRQLTDA